MVPNKTIYVSDGDLPLYQRAQELAGGNLSAAIAAALRRYVEVEEGAARASTRSSFASGPARAARSASSASSSASGSTPRRSRVETYRVYRSRTGKFVLHIERSAEFTMVDAEGKPAGWRGYLGIGNISYGSTPARVDARGRRVARGAPRADPAAALRHGRRLAPPARGRGPRHLSRGAASRAAREVRHDRRGDPLGDPRPPACASRTARRSSSTASTSRSPRARCSRCSGRTAPARRPPSRSSRRCSPPTAARSRSPATTSPATPTPSGALIGVTGQVSAVDELFTGEENLRLMADLRHLGKRRGPAARRRAARALRPGRRGEASPSRPTPAACAAGSTWP